MSTLYAFVIWLIPGQQSWTNYPAPGLAGPNCRGPLDHAAVGVRQAKNSLPVRGRQKPHPQVRVTSGCEPSWPHALQFDTRPGGFCSRLTARLPMICLVVGLVAPTFHQSHTELVNIASSSGGLAIMQTATSHVASTCRLRLGGQVAGEIRRPARRADSAWWTSSLLKSATSLSICRVAWKTIRIESQLHLLNARWKRRITMGWSWKDRLPVWV